MRTLSIVLFFFSTLGLLAHPEDSIGVPPEAADGQILDRMVSIFNEIEDFNRIEVKVGSGVVTLTGTTPDISSAEQAVELAKSLDGVVHVTNALDSDIGVATRLNPAIEKGQEIATTALRSLPLFFIAILVIASFWWLGGLVSRNKRWLLSIGMNELPANLLQRFIKLAMIGIGIFIALEILDATALAGAILGMAGVAGIALGFAFRNIVENYLAGILLSLRNPFGTGDAVEIEGVTGKVVRLTSRDTVLMTFDGNHLRIPNNKIITSTMTNFTRNPLRRFDFAIGVSVELDIVKVRALGMKTLRSIKGILEDPSPKIIIEELGDSTVNMRFYAWIDQRDSDFLKAKSEAIRIVKDAFDESNIEMPEPIYRVHLRNPDQAKPASAKIEEPRETNDDTDVDGANADTAADREIDSQVESASKLDDEPNLLDR